MVNYNDGKIYKLEGMNATNDDDIYIGSTTQKYLCYRFSQHKSDYVKWKNGGNMKYITSFILFNKYGVDGVQIILLEAVSCNSKNELHAKEGDYIKNNKCVNKCIPLQTYKEYNDKVYSNKTICECGSQVITVFMKEHLETIKHNQFLLDGICKEKLFNPDCRNKELNKDKKCYCECGVVYLKKHSGRHNSSNGHLKFINNKSV